MLVVLNSLCIQKNLNFLDFSRACETRYKSFVYQLAEACHDADHEVIETLFSLLRLPSKSVVVRVFLEKLFSDHLAKTSKGMFVRETSMFDFVLFCTKLYNGNSVMCTKCSKWARDRCAKKKRVTTTFSKSFFVSDEPGKEILFFDQVEFVKSFRYLWNRLNASGRSEAVVIARTRIKWIAF